MATEVTLDSIEGWLKEMYPEGPAAIVPEHSFFLKLPFEPQGKGAVGAHINMPVILTNENGVTVAAPDSDAFNLNQPASMQMKQAQVTANQFLIRSKVGYEIVARASSSREAFGDIAAQILESMAAALSKRREASYMYGRSALATARSGGSTTTFPVSDATWAAMLWTGVEGAAVQILRPGSGGNLGKFTNVVAAAAGTSVDDTDGPTGNASNSLCAKIDSVDFDAKTITVSLKNGTAIGSAVAAGDQIFFGGAVTGLVSSADQALDGVSGTYKSPSYREMVGLDAVCGASSTLYGINVSTYGLFKPNSYTTSGALTLQKVLAAQLKSVGKGLDKDSTLLVSFEAMINLIGSHLDPTANSGSTNVKTGAVLNKQIGDSQVRIGAKGIDIVSPAGNLKIVPHMFVKPSEAFIFQANVLKRIGAQDVSFKTPGNDNEKMFLQMPDKAGYEVRQYSNEGLFVTRPGLVTKISGLT